MNSQQRSHDYRQKFKLIAGDSPYDGPDVDLRRDAAGKYHLIWDKFPIRFDRVITPKQAAEFCLERFIPVELHHHFTIK